MNTMRALINNHSPNILALTETKMEDHINILQAIDFTDVIQAQASG